MNSIAFARTRDYVFGVAGGSLPQVMVPEGGDEAKTLAHNLIVIFSYN